MNLLFYEKKCLSIHICGRCKWLKLYKKDSCVITGGGFMWKDREGNGLTF